MGDRWYGLTQGIKWEKRVERGYSTGKGEQSIAQQLSQESYTLIVLAPSDLLLAENGKETVDNNGKWNVYKGGKLVKQYEGFGRTPEQMKELCKKIQNEFK